MRILVVSQYFWPENFRINDLVKEWKKNNIEVEILTGIPNYPSGNVFENYKNNKNKFNFFEGAKIYRVPLSLRGDGSRIKIFFNYLTFFLSASLFAFFKLRKKNYDIIFTFGTSPVTVSLIGIFLSKFTNSKNVIWLLDLWPNILAELKIINNNNIVYKMIKKIVKYIYEKNDIIFAQSKQFKKILSDENKKIKKIELLYSWPEHLDFKLKKFSDDIKFLPEYLNILFTGAIGDAQNFEEILNVLKRLKNHKIRLIVVGDGRKKKWVEDFIKKENLSNIILLKNKPLEEMPKYVCHADILFFSLKAGKFGSATIPGKLSTYLKYNKPILCHASGESLEIIKNNNFGLVSIPGDLNQLEKNIENFYYLKKNNNLNKAFNDSSKFSDFDFKNSYQFLDNQLIKLKAEKDEYKFKLISNVKNIPYNKNFILSGLNLAFVGFLKSKDIKINSKIYLWPDGIFAKRFYKEKIFKISGRKLVDTLQVPKEKNTIHVIGNLPEKSKKYLKERFKLFIKHTPLPFGDIEELKLKLPNINENELIFLTLPTPKQEILAQELSLKNDRFSIFCIGGALNMLGGYEPEPPKFVEKNFEFLWRLRFDTKRRFKRLVFSAIYYFLGEISLEYKKYDKEIL